MVRASTREGVATLGLDRAEKANALSVEMVASLQAAIEDALGDHATHTLVFHGLGAHFCTGFDLSALEEETDTSLAERFIALERLLQAVWYAPVRTIVLAQGRTWGAGADLFASCDVRVANPDTTIRFPGPAFGIVLGTRRLVETIGWEHARPLVTEGATCDAEQALASGLASRIGIAEWLSEQANLPVVDREAHAALRIAVRGDRRAEDLATLIASATRPGLKQRILDYRAGLIAR